MKSTVRLLALFSVGACNLSCMEMPKKLMTQEVAIRSPEQVLEAGKPIHFSPESNRQNNIGVTEKNVMGLTSEIFNEVLLKQLQKRGFQGEITNQSEPTVLIFSELDRLKANVISERSHIKTYFQSYIDFVTQKAKEFVRQNKKVIVINFWYKYDADSLRFIQQNGRWNRIAERLQTHPNKRFVQDYPRLVERLLTPEGLREHAKILDYFKEETAALSPQGIHMFYFEFPIPNVVIPPNESDYPYFKKEFDQSNYNALEMTRLVNLLLQESAKKAPRPQVPPRPEERPLMPPPVPPREAAAPQIGKELSAEQLAEQIKKIQSELRKLTLQAGKRPNPEDALKIAQFTQVTSELEKELIAREKMAQPQPKKIAPAIKPPEEVQRPEPEKEAEESALAKQLKERKSGLRKTPELEGIRPSKQQEWESMNAQTLEKELSYLNQQYTKLIFAGGSGTAQAKQLEADINFVQALLKKISPVNEFEW